MSKTLNIIIGASGQLGHYLNKLCGEYKSEDVLLVNRRSARADCAGQNKRINEEIVDIMDGVALNSLFRKASIYKNVYVFHTAAQSHVGVSFTNPSYTMKVNTEGTLNVLDAIRNYCSHARMVFCASSEMFGYASNKYPIQDENTPMWPRSPYAISKLAGYHLVRNYREAYGLNLWNSINFNFESPKRGGQFVTRKVTKFFASLVNVANPTNMILKMGNVDAVRDWSHAYDIARGMRAMVLSKEPADYVLSSGKTHTVKDLIEKSCAFVNQLRMGRGLAPLINPLVNHVSIDPEFIRPSDLSYLHGNSSLAKTRLNWKPKYTFDMMINEMIIADLAEIEKNV